MSDLLGLNDRFLAIAELGVGGSCFVGSKGLLNVLMGPYGVVDMAEYGCSRCKSSECADMRKMETQSRRFSGTEINSFRF
jgi:hypothetical protein